jgi:hypothetical protein
MLPDLFAVCRLNADAPIPDWALMGDFFSVTRTDDELSIVCRQEQVPHGVTSEIGWRCLKARGPIAFSMVGVVASLTVPLAQAGISIFVISTYDTDYVMVKEENVEKAIAALVEHGHAVLETEEA